MEHKFSLADFRKAHQAMIAKVNNSWSKRYGSESTVRYREYTPEEVDRIINADTNKNKTLF